MNEENMMSMSKVFGLRGVKQKPRISRQLWVKDVGYDEAPWYNERMGLTELEDFLNVAGERIDYVKIATTQVLSHPTEWLKRKIELYKKHSVQPYLDHGFFLRAYKNGIVDEAIEAGAELGFPVIEFMNTFGDVSDQQIKAWRKHAINCGMSIIYEHHPERGWRKGSSDVVDVPATAAEIVQGAEPFLAHGAFTLLIDHEEIEIQEEAAKDVLNEVQEILGKDRVAFEVTSTKEAEMMWYANLLDYFEMFGSDCNVTNIMPSQVMLIDLLRSGERPAELLYDRYPELDAVRNK
jgi:phosphosulfolactate synthase (CoM biosynthesis protein A)